MQKKLPYLNFFLFTGMPPSQPPPGVPMQGPPVGVPPAPHVNPAFFPPTHPQAVPGVPPVSRPVSIILLPLWWASTGENLSSVVYEQHRPRPAWAFVQADQGLCYLYFGKYHTSKILIKLFCVAEETGLSLVLSETPKTGFVLSSICHCALDQWRSRASKLSEPFCHIFYEKTLLWCSLEAQAFS